MSQWKPTPEERAFVQSGLQAVSRSFALVIPMLEAPLDVSVGAAYLLCRVCDNIEDCTVSMDTKRERFAAFRECLADPTQAHALLRQWSHAPWPGLTPAEQELMTEEGGGPLWSLFARMPEDHVHAISRWVEEMSHGMEAFQLSSDNGKYIQSHGVSVLSDLEALDRYCYYVAGTVGHMCTELISQTYALEPAVVEILEHHSVAFGRALQKTNIFKDFYEDLQRGVSYLPWTWLQQAGLSPLSTEGAPAQWQQELLLHIWEELDRAVDYVLALPYHTAAYRLFCLRAILPAYETLLASIVDKEQLFTRRHKLKISREQMMQCMVWADSMERSNTKLLQHRHERTKHRDQLLQRSSQWRPQDETMVSQPTTRAMVNGGLH